jgi:small subunit ribosomal protein S21
MNVQWEFARMVIGLALETGEHMPLRMRVHDREPIALALRRFKKLLERSGIQKELRKRKYYEKPCEARRRAELRKQSAIRKAKNLRKA